MAYLYMVLVCMDAQAVGLHYSEHWSVTDKGIIMISLDGVLVK